MKKGLLLAVALFMVCSLLTGNAKTMVLFDFDALNWLDGPNRIENYMESLYGSDIEVRHAFADDGVFPGPLHDYYGDLYIQNMPGLHHWFFISFREVPMTSVSFDWGVSFDAFHAYADYDQELPTELSDFDLNFFNEKYHMWKSGKTTYDFDRPVYSLGFTDGLGGEIGIDNLRVGAAQGVAPTPEPSTLVLLGMGLIGLGAYGRFRRKKR